MQSSRFTIETLGEPTVSSPLDRDAEINFVSKDERLAYSPKLSALKQHMKDCTEPEGFEVAGPRAKIYFTPPKVRAAIVTCGGLCPGINAVIRSLVMQLWYRYNCRNVLGIRYGFAGLSEDGEVPIVLTPKHVSNIHQQGGTILGTSRGTPSPEEIVDHLVRHKIDVFFAIGGDGTMRGVTALWEEIKRRQLKIAVIGVPKTIDNDIPFVRPSFGFETAVSQATHSIHSAHIEATGVPYGIGLVKLMGRGAGYIAATASLATGHANFCLIPEVPFGLDGRGGLLDLIEDRIVQRRHAVVVVAEGAGQYFFSGAQQKRDASGNVKLGDIGHFLKEKINGHFAKKQMDVVLKYIDPSYMIRSAPADPNDQLYCSRLAQNAVHAAMAGKSGMLIGNWHGLMTHVPTAAVSTAEQRINPRGELWFNVLETTGQPAAIGTV